MNDASTADLIDEVIDAEEREADNGAAGGDPASGWPEVGQRVALQSPPLADGEGSVTSWEVAASSPPFIALMPIGDPLPLEPGMPIMLSVRAGPRLNELEGVVTDVWSTGHLTVRLTPPVHRRYPRYSRAIKVKLQWLDTEADAPRTMSGVSVDLSFGGLRLRVLGPIARGDRMFVFIPVPRQDPIQAVAKVVRELPIDDDGWHEVGLEFTTVSESHRARLLQFLSGQSLS